MINKIQTNEVKNSVKNTLTPSQNTCANSGKVGFRGAESLIIQGLQACERHPMLNVSVLDLSTAIVPRTIIETYSGSTGTDDNGKKKRKANVLAGMEAFRREGSGLLINCLIPGFIVAGVAKLLQRPIMGKTFGKTNLSNVWADSQVLDKVSKYYTGAKGVSEHDKVNNAFRSMLSDLYGLDGNAEKGGIKKFSTLIDVDKQAKELTDCVFNNGSKKDLKKAIKAAYYNIINKTHAGEHIKFTGDKEYLSTNLQGLVDDSVRVFREFHKEGIKDESAIKNYIARAKKLVKVKSLGGMAIVIPLAISAQPINRWITRKTSGKKGAPIYDEFRNDDKGHGVHLSSKEKAELLGQKVISISSMVGVALLSMMRLPKMNMLEFKGQFPSMDMARIVSTATFASRMAASEDKHELRLSTVRDITTFASMYFLGDYAAKAIATGIEKKNPEIKLLNRHKEVDKNAGALKKFWNWVKNTSLKSTDELATQKLKNVRQWCQVGNIGFSLLLLGLLVPMLTVSKARKGRNEELAKKQSPTLNDEISLSENGRTPSGEDAGVTGNYNKVSFEKFSSKAG